MTDDINKIPLHGKELGRQAYTGESVKKPEGVEVWIASSGAVTVMVWDSLIQFTSLNHARAELKQRHETLLRITDGHRSEPAAAFLQAWTYVAELIRYQRKLSRKNKAAL